MKTSAKFDINNQAHVSILSRALHIAQNVSLDRGKEYLSEHFQIAPIKALIALFSHNLGNVLTLEQQRYVKAYTEAVHLRFNLVPGTYGMVEEKDWRNYPDDFNPELYDLD